MTELDVEIAVLIPCRDEESTIASVVNGFQMALLGPLFMFMTMLL